MEKALFALRDYRFDKVRLDLSDLSDKMSLGIEFTPSGKYDPKTGVFSLTFAFKAFKGKAGSGHPVITIECNAVYSFNEAIPFEDIPVYFYSNSIAILFPYVRAFVSTLTLQANVQPVMLPTFNLESLKDELLHKTVVVK